MANVDYWAGSWVGDDLLPNETHDWIMWGFQYGDAVSLTAQAVTGNPNAGERILRIENQRFEGDPSGRRLYYTVRNVSNEPIPGYIVGFAMISQ